MGLMDLFKAKKNQQLTEQLAQSQQQNQTLTRKKMMSNHAAA